MVKSFLSITFFILVLSTSVYSQKFNSYKTVELPTNFHERLDFSGAYYGDMIWNPGLKFGAEYVWKEKLKEKEKRKGTKTISKQKILSGDFGFYHSNHSQIEIFNYYGIILRRTSSKNNRQFNFKFNPLGFYRSFLHETYEVIGGDVSKVPLAGRNYYAPSISIGTGKMRDDKMLKARFINLNFMLLMPYNNSINPMISIDFGYRFNIKKRNQINTQNK